MSDSVRHERFFFLLNNLTTCTGGFYPTNPTSKISEPTRPLLFTQLSVSSKHNHSIWDVLWNDIKFFSFLWWQCKKYNIIRRQKNYDKKPKSRCNTKIDISPWQMVRFSWFFFKQRRKSYLNHNWTFFVKRLIHKGVCLTRNRPSGVCIMFFQSTAIH
jgi:hypothetical protein